MLKRQWSSTASPYLSVVNEVSSYFVVFAKEKATGLKMVGRTTNWQILFFTWQLEF